MNNLFVSYLKKMCMVQVYTVAIPKGSHDQSLFSVQDSMIKIYLLVALQVSVHTLLGSNTFPKINIEI